MGLTPPASALNYAVEKKIAYRSIMYECKYEDINFSEIVTDSLEKAQAYCYSVAVFIQNEPLIQEYLFGDVGYVNLLKPIN